MSYMIGECQSEQNRIILRIQYQAFLIIVTGRFMVTKIFSNKGLPLFPEAVSQISKNGLLNPAHRIRTEQKRVHELFFGFCIFFLFVQSNSNLIVD